MLKGNNMILSLDGKRLAASRGCSIDRDTDTIEVCSPVEGPAKRYIPSTTGWSIAASGLYATTEGAEVLRKIWRKYQHGGEQTPLHVRVTTDGVPEVGEAILTSLHEDGNYNELVKFSISLQGSGKLRTERTLDLTFDIDDMHIYFDANGHLHVVDDEDDQIDSVDLDIESDGIIQVSSKSIGVINGGWMILRGTTRQFSQDIYNGRVDAVEPYIVAYGQNRNGQSGVLPAGAYCVFACNYESYIVATVLE